MKKILFAASECVPFIKTGGLADVCGALPKTFNKKEWDVRVVIPNYNCIPFEYRSQFSYVTHFYMGSGSYIRDKYVGVLQYEYDGITYYFIDNEEYFSGPAMVIFDMTLRSSAFLIKRCFPCFRSLVFSQILFIVMTGRPV